MYVFEFNIIRTGRHMSMLSWFDDSPRPRRLHVIDEGYFGDLDPRELKDADAIVRLAFKKIRSYNIIHEVYSWNPTLITGTVSWNTRWSIYRDPNIIIALVRAGYTVKARNRFIHSANLSMRANLNIYYYFHMLRGNCPRLPRDLIVYVLGFLR